MRTQDLANFIATREELRISKDAAPDSPPWTDDAILAKFRFCNVQREHDRVTQWIRQHVREPLSGNDHLWFALVICRLVNWPETIHSLGNMLPWNRGRFLKTLNKRKARNQKVFGGAYIVSTNGQEIPKAEYLAEYVLDPLWYDRRYIMPRDDDTLASFADRLMEYNGFKGFMAGQVVADLKYDKGGPLATATDWWTWAVSGPGSRRGLNRVMGNELRDNWKEPLFLKTLTKLREELNAKLKSRGLKLHAQDIQNCLCEFDKYERVRLGEGTPRALYRSHDTDTTEEGEE